MMKLISVSSFLPLGLISAHDYHVHEKWETHPTRLPTPISDLSATLDPESGLVFLMGGCSSPLGNERIPNTTYFSCADITDSSHAFDPETGEITTLPDLPRERFRHTAALSNGRIWLIGGRDVNDVLIPQVDVYDIASKSWLSKGLVLPSDFLTSDLASFGVGELIYVMGGYDQNYTEAVNTTFSIKTDQPLSESTLTVQKLTDLKHARGDAHVGVANGQAYLIGGFTHVDDYCEALDTVERYDWVENTWSTADELQYRRGDKAVVVIDNTKIYAIGGESNTDCTGPGQRTTPTTEVEVLDTSEENPVWREEVADLPDDHFRFSAVAVGTTIFTFGGQQFYNGACDCFQTRNTILMYSVDHDDDDSLSGGAIAGIVIGAIVAVGAVAALLVYGSKVRPERNFRETELTNENPPPAEEVN